MNTDRHTLRAGGAEATIKALGAELCSFKDVRGTELIWQAGAAWPRHAPLLFPIVGRLKNDELRYRGQLYQMTQHGFARDQTFEWLEQDASSCSLMLRDSEATRARYPFPFRLVVRYQLQENALDVTLKVTNTGGDILPASIGAHPAFNWPLSEGLPKESYRLVFSDPEPEPVRRLDEGLLRERPEPTPIVGKTLALSEHLFDDDALILDRVSSQSVRFEADAGPSLEISWDGFRELGIWSKPNAAFLCIEPWCGFASPSNFDGDFAGKPGVLHISPDETKRVRYRIAVD